MRIKKLYTQIGPFCILITVKSLQSAVSQDVLLRISAYLSGFITNKPFKNPDFAIDIIEDERSRTNYLTIQKGDQIEVYIKNFHILNKHKIITYNGISTYAFDFILKRIIAELLYKHNFFFVHVSACLYQGKAYLFFGKNGAGKSTIVNMLSSIVTPLADDYGIVVKEQNIYYFYQGPFICKNPVKGSYKKYIIQRLFFLQKADSFSMKVVSSYQENNLAKIYKQIINTKNRSEIINLFYYFRANLYKLNFSRNQKELIQNSHKIFS